MHILDYVEQPANSTIVGIFTIQMHNGMMLHQCKLIKSKKNGYFVALPQYAKKNALGEIEKDAYGKSVYLPYIDFSPQEKAKEFQKAALEALKPFVRVNQ